MAQGSNRREAVLSSSVEQPQIPAVATTAPQSGHTDTFDFSVEFDHSASL